MNTFILSYNTLNDQLKLYKQFAVKQNWSPTSERRLSHRIFTDSTEKQAVEQYETKYDNTKNLRDGNHLAALLIMLHNQGNADQGVATNHRVAAMCPCTADGKILPIYFTVPFNQLSKFSEVNEQGQPVSTKKQITTKAIDINNNISINNINVDNSNNNVYKINFINKEWQAST